MQHEAVALLEFLVAECYATGTEQHYRIKFPYEKDPGVEFVVNFSIYFDGVVKDERDPEHTKSFKVTGPDKGRQWSRRTLYFQQLAKELP